MDDPNAPESPVTVVTDTSLTPSMEPFDLLPPPPTRPKFLEDPDGVGWGFLLFVALAATTGAVLSGILHFVVPHNVAKLWSMLISEVAGLGSALLPAFVMGKLERRPFGAYGLPRQGAFGRGFWVGGLWGIVALSVLMLVMRAAGVFYFGGLALQGTRILKFALFWAVLFVVVGLFEEFLLRGYVQFTLSRGLGFWPTAVVLSTAFGSVHLSNPGENWVGALGAGIIGLFFCLTLRRTGNLWFAVGLHASWDWGETYLYSVPNSGLAAPGHLLNSSFHGNRWLTGGSVGPEASVFVFLVIAAMAIAFHFAYREMKYRG